MTYRRLMVHRRVLVNLTTGKAVEGVIVRASGPLIVVKDARLHEPGTEPAPMDGEVLIERSRIDFIQAL